MSNPEDPHRFRIVPFGKIYNMDGGIQRWGRDVADGLPESDAEAEKAIEQSSEESYTYEQPQDIANGSGAC